jgi:hypothetical protein
MRINVSIAADRHRRDRVYYTGRSASLRSVDTEVSGIHHRPIDKRSCLQSRNTVSGSARYPFIFCQQHVNDTVG